MPFLNPNPLFCFLAFLVWSSNVSASPTLARVFPRTTPPSDAVVVMSSGAASGEFTSIQAAVNSLPFDDSSCSIFIYPGTYSEQVNIGRPGPLSIYGYTTDSSSYTSNSVTITYSMSAGQAGNDVASATLSVNKANFSLYNVNLKNTFGKSSKDGQALAVSAGGTKQGYYAVGFYGYQDTVLAETGVQFYGRCYIEGAVDFIFGQHANAFFQKNTIASIGPGSITANGPSNPEGGIFVINDSHVVLASNSTPGTSGSVYLGRPWTEYARVVFSNSNLGFHVNPAKWSIWDPNQPNTEYVLLGEYGNIGPGALGTRAPFSTHLSSTKGYKIKDVLGTDYKTWVDIRYV